MIRKIRHLASWPVLSLFVYTSSAIAGGEDCNIIVRNDSNPLPRASDHYNVKVYVFNGSDKVTMVPLSRKGIAPADSWKAQCQDKNRCQIKWARDGEAVNLLHYNPSDVECDTSYSITTQQSDKADKFL